MVTRTKLLTREQRLQLKQAQMQQQRQKALVLKKRVTLPTQTPQQKKLIDELKLRIERFEKRQAKDQKRYRDTGKGKYKARVRGRSAQIKEVKNIISQVNQGNIYDINKIDDYLNDVYVGTKREERIKGTYVPEYVIRQQEVEQKKAQAKAEKEFKEITTKVEQGKALTVKDFKKAKELGISNKELLTYAADVTRYEKQLKELKKEGQQQRQQFEKSLGGLTNVLTSKQKDILYKSQFVSTTPYLQLPQVVKSQLKKIDARKDIDALEKEQLKRKVLGQSVTKLGEQLDLFGETVSQKKLKETIEKTFKQQIKRVTLSPAEKIRTGQTITPTEKALYNLQQIEQGKKITQEQINNFKRVGKITISPVIYGQNLALRYQKGENALYNDGTRFFTGVRKGLQDLFVSVFGVKGLTINSKGKSFDGIVAAGVRPLMELEAKWYANAIKHGTRNTRSLIKTDLQRIALKIQKGVKTSADVGSFVIKHPIMTTLIVTAAIDAGIVKSRAAFIKDPITNTGYAFAWLFPGTVIKGAINTVKVGDQVLDASVQGSKKLIKESSALKKRILLSKTSLELNKNLKNYINSIKLYRQYQKKLVTGKIVKGAELKKIQDIFAKFEKNNNVPVGKLTDNNVLKRLGYTPKKVPKAKITPAEIKTLPPVLEVQKLLNTLTNKKELQKIIKQLRELGYAVSKQKLDVKILDLERNRIVTHLWKVKSRAKKKIRKGKISRRIKKEEKKKPKVKVEKKPTPTKKELTEKEIARDIAEQKRREREWKQAFDEAEIKADVKKLFDNKGQLKFSFAKAKFEEPVVIITSKYKKRKQKTNKKIKTLRRGHKKSMQKAKTPNIKKKTQKQNLKQLEKEYKNYKKELEKSKKEIEKKIKSYKKISKTNPKVGKIVIPLIRGMERTLGGIDSELKKTNNIITKIGQEILKLSARLRDLAKPTIPKIAPKSIKKPISPRKPIKPIKKPKSPKVPRVPKKPPVLRIPKIRIKTKGLQTKGIRQAYIIKIKEGNKIVAQSTTGLPKNRATNLMRRRLDNSPQASGELVPKGKTTIVDVKTQVLAKKFRVKKSKKTKVLRNVEKRKYRLDTKGEKKGLKKPKSKK